MPIVAVAFAISLATANMLPARTTTATSAVSVKTTTTAAMLEIKENNRIEIVAAFE